MTDDRLRYVAGVEMTDEYCEALKAANSEPPVKQSRLKAALARFFAEPKCPRCEAQGSMCEECYDFQAIK